MIETTIATKPHDALISTQQKEAEGGLNTPPGGPGPAGPSAVVLLLALTSFLLHAATT